MNLVNFYIAKKYAVSYFLSEGEGIEEKKKVFDLFIDKIIEYLFYLSNPTISFDIKKKIVENILGEYRGNQIKNLILFMIKNKRINLIKEVYKKFSSMYLEFKNMIEVDVISRYDLNEKDKELISSIVFKLTSKKPYIKTSKDDKIIGGFIIRWDDKIIDATINRKIELIVENIINRERS